MVDWLIEKGETEKEERGRGVRFEERGERIEISERDRDDRIKRNPRKR